MKVTSEHSEPVAVEQDDEPAEKAVPACTCMQDAFAALPAALRPQPPARQSNVRRVTCPGCGLKYATNRATDWCFDCERKGLKDGGT